VERYKNLSGDSGVVAYEIRRDSIRVQFGDHIYTYDAATVGRDALQKMKALAVAGRGLSSFISTEVRDSYTSKSTLST